MSNELNLPVVVGVDGSDYALTALDWAARQAAEHGWPLRLANAYQSYVAAMPAAAVTLPPPTEESTKILVEARARVEAAYPDLPVTTVQREGPAPNVLLRESEQARLIVVGREGIGRIAELVLGSVSLEVATRARIPVAVIPASWQPPAEPFGRLVVGVDGSENCQAAVEYAFATAAERGAELVAVYAWHQPSRWPEGWPLGTDEPRFKADYDRILAGVIAPWRDKYPQVKVSTATEVDHPAVALERHAVAADVVVIGGRGHGTVTGMLLGSVARNILRHLDRPVVVVHQLKEG
jgi:nucleotide-binding universal stress UspA family protein